jgi:VWFA-related protein
MATTTRVTVFAGLLVLLLAGGHGRAQQNQQPSAPPPAPAAGQPAQSGQPAQTGQDQTPVFRAGINFVRVDVIALDRSGNPVMDLKPEDFEVTEQNVPQKVETFKLISLDGGLSQTITTPPREIRSDLDEEVEASRDDVRLFGIFLDDYHVRRENSISARDQIARFVETQLGPSDMIGLMYPLEAVNSVRMTRNHDAIIGGIKQFEGRKYDYRAKNEAEQRYVNYYSAQQVETIRNQVSWSAIRSLITHMGGLKEGRKALIIVTEGWNAMLPPQLQSEIAGIPGVNNPNAHDPNAGDNTLMEVAMERARLEIEEDMRELYNTANQYNVSIYTVDPRGLATGEFGMETNINSRTDRLFFNASLDTLRALAVETDGRAIINRNDLTLGMKQIVRDTSAYYLLGYNSSFGATDGKFHEIKVRIKRPGVQVRARKGYWAYTAADAARATSPPPAPVPQPYTAALAAISNPARARLVRTWIGNERGSDGKTRVTFVWEAVPRPAGDRSRADDVPARVSLTAAGMDGTPYFRGRVPSAAPAPPTGTSVISFEAPPGPVQLRVAVESASSEVLDSEVREIVVPDLGASKTSIGTPSVYRARTVRDFQQLKADPRAVPTATREFTRTDRVFVRVTAYGDGAQPPAVTAQLLNRTGQPINTLAATPGPGGATDLDLSLAVLPAGEYLIEITAAGGAGEPVKEVLGFRITG